MTEPRKSKAQASGNSRKTVRIVIISLWSLFGLGAFSLAALFFAIGKGWLGSMPSMSDMENPIDKFASQIISEDGKVMGSYSFSGDNRVWVDFDELSPFVTQALIATEDIRYLEHSGIDFRSLARAVIKTVISRQNTGGGSTITQQLAKLLYTQHVASGMAQRMTQKPIEWVIAVKLERYYTKEEILTMYMNKYDFGYNSVGIYTAANTYFGKLPSELNIQESTMLVGMLQNSSLYNPLRRVEQTTNRRNLVLNQMNVAGWLTKEKLDSVKQLPLGIDFHRVDHKEGQATYFREYLRGVLTAKEPVRKNYRGWQMQEYYEDSLAWADNPLYGWCNKNSKPDGTPYNVYTDGLRIFVTIDSRMQKFAEDAVAEHLVKTLQPNFFKAKKNRKNAPFSNKISQEDLNSILDRAMRQSDAYRSLQAAGRNETEIRKVFETPRPMTLFSYEGPVDTVLSPMDSIRYIKHYLRTGFMVMEPSSGHVKAYVGGPDYRQFQYDMVTKGRRQVGSTIKPYLYSLAMESGFSPCDEVRNETQTILTEAGRIWQPRDAGTARLGEMVTLKWGLSQSNNNITAYLMSRLSPYEFKNLLQEFGFKNQAIDPVPSLCLGTCDVSVMEMVSAYTAFPNKGVRTEPLFVTRIEDSEGNVLEQFSAQSNEVLSESTSYKMIDMLRAVIDSGTGVRIRSLYRLKMDCCGKTGTTDNHSDAWFMGFTPHLVGGCWIGGEDRDIHFDTMEYGQGSHAALPIWALFMKSVYEHAEEFGYDPEERFDIPQGFDPCATDLNLSTAPAYSSESYSIDNL